MTMLGTRSSARNWKVDGSHPSQKLKLTNYRVHQDFATHGVPLDFKPFDHIAHQWHALMPLYFQTTQYCHFALPSPKRRGESRTPKKMSSASSSSSSTASSSSSSAAPSSFVPPSLDSFHCCVNCGPTCGYPVVNHCDNDVGFTLATACKCCNKFYNRKVAFDKNGDVQAVQWDFQDKEESVKEVSTGSFCTVC